MRALRIVLTLLTVLGASVAIGSPILLATKDLPFTVASDTLVYYCADATEAAKAIAGTAGAKCNPPKLINAGTARCDWATFGPVNGVMTDPAQGIDKPCYRKPDVPFRSCYPDLDISLTWTGIASANYHYGDVPASVGARDPYIGWWIDTCKKLYVAQYFNDDDVTALRKAAVKQLLGNSDAINAWVAAQPTEDLTTAEDAYKSHFLAVLNQQTAVLAYVVQPISSTVVGDRPVYRLKADGTLNATAVSGKRAIGNTPCGSKAIGSYRDIPSLKDATGDVYALCKLKP